MRFAHRAEAAGLLAEELRRSSWRHPLVLGIARGGVRMAGTIAQALGCPRDVVLVRKLRLPEVPDQAVGVVDELGHVYLHDARLAARREPSPGEIIARFDELRRLRRLYTPDRPRLAAAGRTAIIVDDGLITGTTMVAAIRSVRAQRPLRVVAGVPVAARDGLDLVRAYADEVVCLHLPRAFYALDDFYDDFRPVLDSDVVESLNGPPAGDRR